MNQRIDFYIPLQKESLRDCVEKSLKQTGFVCGVGITGNWWNIYGWIPAHFQLRERFERVAQQTGFKVYFPEESDSSIPQEIIDTLENLKIDDD